MKRLLSILLLPLLACADATNNTTMPLGIPVPDFGWTNSHWSATNWQYDFGAGPVDYPTYSLGGTNWGPYSHFVDNAHASSDDANTFGTPSAPRKTIPNDLYTNAGAAIVMVKSLQAFDQIQRLRGSSLRPAFVVGVNSIDGVRCNVNPDFYGWYAIVENLRPTNCNYFTVRADNWTNNSHHWAFRDIYMDGKDYISNASPAAVGAALAMNTLNDGPYCVSNVVFARVRVRGYGDHWLLRTGTAVTDNDGIKVAGNATRTWILDSEFSHISGGSSTFGNQDGYHPDDWAWWPQFLYYGRNHSYSNRESCMDIKAGIHAVFSENVMHDSYPTADAQGNGGGFVSHYGATNIWIINNLISNCNFAIGSSGSRGCYWLGNRAIQVTNGAQYWASSDTVIANNTFITRGTGINEAGVGSARGHYYNNILAFDGFVGDAVELNDTAAAAVFRNNLLPPNGTLQWSATEYATLAAMQAATSKGENCSTNNPLLTSATDLHILTSSPAIDAGTNIAGISNVFWSSFGIPLNLDFDRASRFQGAAIDIGADEQLSTGVSRIFGATIRAGTFK